MAEKEWIPTETERKYPILRGLNLSDEEIDFLEEAYASGTAKINQTRTVSELYTLKNHEKLVDAMIESNRELSDSTAKWAQALVWLTAALVIVTLAQVALSFATR